LDKLSAGVGLRPSLESAPWHTALGAVQNATPVDSLAQAPVLHIPIFGVNVIELEQHERLLCQAE
jgi:hypothetical protein